MDLSFIIIIFIVYIFSFERLDEPRQEKSLIIKLGCTTNCSLNSSGRILKEIKTQP